MAKEYRFTLPAEEQEVRRLKIGDIVYLTGTCYTMRDMGHRRSIEILQQEEALPFNLAKGALWHCGPIVKKEGESWQVVSAGSTTSSRFTPLGSELIRQVKVRFTIGKGTMGPEAVAAMQEIGACYLNSIGGCAALYAEQIKAVKTVFWTDLGLPEAIWVLEVENLGPLVVGIDSHGQSLFENIKKDMQKALQEIYAASRLEKGYSYTYLPRRVPGKLDR
ncbi:MAG: fumarate hydratase subunit beta [Clostridia bacterium]|nr:fumarate hydratase subunit beta [Clostridia bacterium]